MGGNFDRPGGSGVVLNGAEWCAGLYRAVGCLAAAVDFLMGAALLVTLVLVCCKAVEETVAVSVDCLGPDAVVWRLVDFKSWTADFDGNLGRMSLPALILLGICLKLMSDVVVLFLFSLPVSLSPFNTTQTHAHNGSTLSVPTAAYLTSDFTLVS